MRLFVVACIVATVVACATDDAVVRRMPMDPGTALVMDLEGRMYRAASVRVESRLVSTGAVQSNLRATLVLGQGNQARLDVDGVLNNQPTHRTFVSDGTHMSIDGAAPTAAAPQLREAIVFGFVRMGLLHNAARLAAAQVPDHSDADAYTWMRASNAHVGERATDVAFDVVVDRKERGAAQLFMDDQGRPMTRTQHVDMNGSVMHVTETYVHFDLDVPLDPATFTVPGAPPTAPAAPSTDATPTPTPSTTQTPATTDATKPSDDVAGPDDRDSDR